MLLLRYFGKTEALEVPNSERPFVMLCARAPTPLRTLNGDNGSTVPNGAKISCDKEAGRLLVPVIGDTVQEAHEVVMLLLLLKDVVCVVDCELAENVENVLEVDVDEVVLLALRMCK